MDRFLSRRQCGRRLGHVALHDGCRLALGLPGTGYFCNGTGAGAANAAALDASGTGDHNDTAFTGGVQGGFNYQWGSAVLGIETDYDSFNLGGTRTAKRHLPGGRALPPGALPPGTAYTITQSFDTNWLWTLRGRVGWLVRPDLLVYATGGWALTNLEVSFTYSDNNGATSSGSASANKNGWTIGGGLEWALNNHWSVRAEYLYFDFGKVTATGNVPSTALKGGAQNALSTTGDLTANIARLGVNYRF